MVVGSPLALCLPCFACFVSLCSPCLYLSRRQKNWIPRPPPPHPMMHLCTNTRCLWAMGAGESNRKPWSGLGHRESRRTLADRPTPPVEPALYHRGSPTLAGAGWGT